MKTCIYPGSFDPIHLGHIDIINRLCKIFDKVIIAPLQNKHKSGRFSIDDRIIFIEKSIKKLSNSDKIEIVYFEQMLVNYVYSEKIDVIIKGVRNTNDFILEKDMADSIRLINDDVETLFLPSTNKYNSISSTIVYDVILNNGDLKPFVPIEIIDDIVYRFGGTKDE